jgi:hypothetical protein
LLFLWDAEEDDYVAKFSISTALSHDLKLKVKLPMSIV